METHIRDLAAGHIEPAQRPRSAASKSKASGKSKTASEAAKPPRTGGVYERSRI
jgi:hypothetical protein